MRGSIDYRDPAGIADPASESGDALYEVTHGAKVQ